MELKIHKNIRVLYWDTLDFRYITVEYNSILNTIQRGNPKISFRLWTHKLHLIPRPYGRAMSCLLWVFFQYIPQDIESALCINQGRISYGNLFLIASGKLGRISSRWHHQMETFSAVLALCAGNSPVTGEFLAQKLVTRSFDVFFDLRLNQQTMETPVIWDAH